MSLRSELPALAGCAALGALATAGPWFVLGMRIDRILLVPAVQIACLWTVWAVCLSRKVSWLSREWSPFAVGAVGSGAGLLAGNAAFVLLHRTDDPLWRDFVAALVPFFWFSGWFATLAVGFLGGWTLGQVLKKSPSERSP